MDLKEQEIFEKALDALVGIGESLEQINYSLEKMPEVIKEGLSRDINGLNQLEMITRTLEEIRNALEP